MNVCGKDGNELRCCKTGLTIHDSRFHPLSRHAADMFYCEKCGMTFIKRNNYEYFDEHNGPVDAVISADGIEWTPSFTIKMHNQYGLVLIDNVDDLFTVRLRGLL